MIGLIGVPPLPAKDALECFLPLAKDGQVKCTMPRGHLDGWGISGFSEGRAVYFGRRAASAVEDAAAYHEAVQKAQKSQSPVILGHFRKASTGACDISNTHPFHEHDWIFAHNGTVYGAPASFSLMDARPQGNTDSERLFFWILEQVRSEFDVTAALVKLLKESRPNLVFSSLTFLMSDGKTLWAYRDYGDKRLEPGETLQEREKYYTLYTTRLNKTAVVCSEALASLSSQWEPLAQKTLAVFTTQTPAPQIFKI